MVAVIRLEVDQHAGDLEPYIGGDAGPYRAEAEDLLTHIRLSGGGLDLDRPQESSARSRMPPPQAPG